MTLLTAAFFYVITGSAAFIRRKLDPNHPNPDFDYAFGLMFRAGIALFAFAIPALLFPSPYWNIALLVILIVTTRRIFKRFDAILFDRD